MSSENGNTARSWYQRTHRKKRTIQHEVRETHSQSAPQRVKVHPMTLLNVFVTDILGFPLPQQHNLAHCLEGLGPRCEVPQSIVYFTTYACSIDIPEKSRACVAVFIAENNIECPALAY
jgi:hypothetical protein